MKSGKHYNEKKNKFICSMLNFSAGALSRSKKVEGNLKTLKTLITWYGTLDLRRVKGPNDSTEGQRS